MSTTIPFSEYLTDDSANFSLLIFVPTASNTNSPKSLLSSRSRIEIVL